MVSYLLLISSVTVTCIQNKKIRKEGAVSIHHLRMWGEEASLAGLEGSLPLLPV